MRTRQQLCNPDLGYMPQLDGLRGVGVLIVMLHHFAPVTMRGSLRPRRIATICLANEGMANLTS